jgi:hypothetical protein
MNMTKNIGTIDRTLRLGVGLALVVWGLLSQNWLGAIGLIPISTPAISWCPAYTLYGMNTSKTAE